MPEITKKDIEYYIRKIQHQFYEEQEAVGFEIINNPMRYNNPKIEITLQNKKSRFPGHTYIL